MESQPTTVIKSKGNNHKLYQKQIAYSVFKLFVGEFNSQDHEIDNILDTLTDASSGDLIDIYISSSGGYTSDLMKTSNILRSNFQGRCKTILNHYGYSAGAMLFLCGDERIIFENSELMFHTIRTRTHGKLKDIERETAHSKKHWEGYATRLLTPYFSKQELQQLLEGREFWMDAIEICQRGICTGVDIGGNIITPQEYLKLSKAK